MTAAPAYRFASAAQWATTLSSPLGGAVTLDPADGILVRTAPCDITAFAIDGEDRLIVDCDGVLSTGSGCGPDLGTTRRIVFARDRIWVLAGDRLVELDRATFQAIRSSDAAGMRDIAAGPWLLGEKTIYTLDGAERPLSQLAIQIAAIGKTLALLAESRTALLLILDNVERKVDLAAALKGLVPAWGGFTVSRLSGGRLLLAEGQWEDGTPGLLLIDDAGGIVERARWTNSPAPQTVALDGDALVAAFRARLLRFALSAAGGALRLTPALETETPAGTWLRADVEARLPEGATLACRWAAAADDALRGTLEAIHRDETKSPAARAQQIAGLLAGHWSNSFSYEGEAGGGALERFAFPLHAAPAGSTLWLELRLDGPGSIETLSVFHDAQGLMAYLPAIYRGEGDGDGSYRRLVDVVEATTQSIDEAIGQLARLLDPLRTDERWLPSLAAMLGLPFDTTLDVTMQRRLVAAAPALIEHRSTRTGLVTMLGALFPGRLVRIEDRAATAMAIMLGGSALPALLSGPAVRVPRLNARLVLGRTALCPADPCDEGLIAPAAEVIVTIPATPRERARLAAALDQMIEAMIPAGVILRLRWTAWTGLAAKDGRDVIATVDAPIPAQIGSTALGQATLGGRRDPAIAADGVVAIGHQLM